MGSRKIQETISADVCVKQIIKNRTISNKESEQTCKATLKFKPPWLRGVNRPEQHLWAYQQSLWKQSITKRRRRSELRDI